jgi:predicted nucleotidyltransferase
MTLYKYSKTIEDIASEYDISFFVYFGSYQTDYYNEDSDIDIAFLAQKDMTAQEQLKLLEELIKYHRKSEIDLIDLRKACPILRYEVALNGRAIYEKEKGQFDKYSLFYIKQFYELKPIIEDELKAISEEIRELIDNA